MKVSDSRAVALLQDKRLHRKDRRQVLGDLAKAFAFVAACEERAGARAEIDAGRIEPIGRHRLAQYREVGVRLWQAPAHRLP